MAAFSSKVVAVFYFFLSSCAEKMEPYVVGGDYARIDQYPHSVYLLVENNGEAWICGASIVNQMLLLTAAHCLEGCLTDWSVKAYAGSANVNEICLTGYRVTYLSLAKFCTLAQTINLNNFHYGSNSEITKKNHLFHTFWSKKRAPFYGIIIRLYRSGGTVSVSSKAVDMKVLRMVSKYIIHKYYESKRSLNDIALAYMKKAVPFGRTIQRVILKPNFKGVKKANVAGWGLVNDQTEEETEQLKAVTQKLQSKSNCKEVGEILKGMMCAKNNNKNRPSKGDSGSALVTTNGQQIGLVSFRHPHAPELVIYTNVSYFYDWIQRSSRMLFCPTKG